jgi:cell division protease FtsH
MMVPAKDILNHSRKHALNQICCSMGGRVAEELVFSEAEITTGAAADIRSATKLARKMVCDWGMSELGPLAFGENREHIFLGQEIAREQNYSEQTAQKIDTTISQIVGEQDRRATEILVSKRECMEILVQALLEHETLEGKYVYEVVEHGRITSELPRAVPDPAPSKDPEIPLSSESIFGSVS